MKRPPSNPRRHPACWTSYRNHPGAIFLSCLLMEISFALIILCREIRRQSLAVPSLQNTIGARRHSVPVNMEPPLPRTIYRRESLPVSRAALAAGRSPISPVQIESRTSSGLREEDELMKFGSQSSLLSSSPHLSSGILLSSSIFKRLSALCRYFF